MGRKIERTFGWVQEASSISSLKNVVSVFVPNSEMNKKLREDKIPRLIKKEDGRDEFIRRLSKEKIEIPYMALKGRGPRKGETRRTAPCSGIIQATLPGQRREYQSDWPADSYLRWAISLGLLSYDEKKDTCRISKLGLEYVYSDCISKEEKILTKAFLLNPPVVRVLSLLEKHDHLTKFEIGERLGFIGESGFTSIPQALVIQAIVQEPEQRNKILQDVEGTSDKYARMICRWLIQLGWVQQVEKKVTETIGKESYTAIIPQSYMLTLKGRTALKKAYGTSTTRRVPRLVLWNMLATKPSDKNYLRNRRALIIQYTNQDYRTLEEIQKFLKQKGYSESLATIEDDLKSFQHIGLEINVTENGYKVMDDIIGLALPSLDKPEKFEKSELTEVKDFVRNKLKVISHKYLVLIDLSYDGRANRDFEIMTAELLTKELDFQGVRLGGPNQPDSVIYFSENGLIIDNKAYSRGYSLPMAEADKMIRYLEENKKRDNLLNPSEWWNYFDSEVKMFNFAFVSSKFTGKFEEKLEYIANRTFINGAAITSVNLLFLAEQLKTHKLSYKDCFKLFSKNKEIKLI